MSITLVKTDWTLYKSYDQSDDTELSLDEALTLKTKSQNFTSQLKEQFLMLIFQFYAVNECDGDVTKLNKTILPYGMRSRNSAVQFDVQRLPNKLQRMLYKFCNTI